VVIRFVGVLEPGVNLYFGERVLVRTLVLDRNCTIPTPPLLHSINIHAARAFAAHIARTAFAVPLKHWLHNT
jgi:hypothetical protein